MSIVGTGTHEHVQKSSDGGAMCRHCGGEVGDDGYARNMFDGGEVEMTDHKEEGEAPASIDSDEYGEPDQMIDTEARRKSAFMEQIRRGRR